YPPPPGAQRRRPAVAPAPAPAPKKIVKISAPQYYPYKTDALKPVDFTPILSASATVGAAPRQRSDLASALESVELLAEAEIGKALNEFYSSSQAFIWVEA